MTTAFVSAMLVTAGTVIVLWWSRRALLHPGSHGFYRFFAWEAILALIVINRQVWGNDPFALPQMISWLLMIISIALVVIGVRTLRRDGHTNPARNDATLYAWEQTDRLVTTGVYSYIRHPMYASLLALTWGAFMQQPSWWCAPIAGVGSIFLQLTALSDERECRAWFGEQYSAYMNRTRRFIPYIY